MFDTLKDVMNTVESKPPARYSTIGDIFVAVINAMIGLGFAFGIVSITWAMLQYIMSKGDPKLTSRAWNGFVYGVVASLVSISVLVFRDLILKAFGVTDPTILDPTSVL